MLVMSVDTDIRKSTVLVVRKDIMSESEVVKPLSRSLGNLSTQTSSSPINFPE